MAIPAVSPSQAAALGLTTRLPAAYRRVCSKQAAAAPPGARVCPPLIPAGRLKVDDATAWPQHGASGGYFSDLMSPSLSELRGAHIETNGGHWHYGVSWSPAVTRQLVRNAIERPVNAKPSSCRHLRIGAEPVEACRVVSYTQGGGLHGGHIAYVWLHRTATFVVSLHGYANEPRARAMMVALMEKVVPRGD